ncbi:unnamed protein product [Peronospora belbahrii]|uniref:Uncharacterized protein n=1 Tax=Peronospora belbahrii TaxID=622444 RepID=A0AAU9LDD1_9STRA|nr:unnamed protein product [Peronospora belbahrii]CAH0520958.1 unnamed protein product [Peronospora belbahrii]
MLLLSLTACFRVSATGRQSQNPICSGKLPITYPKDPTNTEIPYNHLVSTRCLWDNCAMRWEFGASFSYTKFNYSSVSLDKTTIINADDTLTASHRDERRLVCWQGDSRAVSHPSVPQNLGARDKATEEVQEDRVATGLYHKRDILTVGGGLGHLQTANRIWSKQDRRGQQISRGNQARHVVQPVQEHHEPSLCPIYYQYRQECRQHEH